MFLWKFGMLLAGIGCLSAQSPAPQPRLSPGDIQRLLLDRDGQPRELAKGFLGGDTNRYFEVKDGGHGDSLARQNGAYRKRMLAWLDDVM